MKFAPVCFLVVCCYHLTFVNSLVIDSVLQKFGDIKNGIKCGVHKIGDGFYRHDHHYNPCEHKHEGVKPEFIEHNHLETNEEKPVNALHDNLQTTESEIDVRYESKTLRSTTENEIVTVPEGRTLLGVKSNCASGTRDDGTGKCREKY